MKWKHKAVVCLSAILATLLTPAFSLAKQVEPAPENRQEVSKEWQEMRKVQRELVSLKETLKKEHEELRSLAEQKHVKLDMSKYHELMKKAHELKEADKKLIEELKAAGQAGNEAKEKEILIALTAHKKHKLEVMKEAQKLLSSEIQKLKNLPS